MGLGRQVDLQTREAIHQLRLELRFSGKASSIPKGFPSQSKLGLGLAPQIKRARALPYSAAAGPEPSPAPPPPVPKGLASPRTPAGRRQGVCSLYPASIPQSSRPVWVWLSEEGWEAPGRGGRPQRGSRNSLRLLRVLTRVGSGARRPRHGGRGGELHADAPHRAGSREESNLQLGR